MWQLSSASSVSNDFHDMPLFQHVILMHAGCVFTDKQGQRETRFSLCVQQSPRLAASAVQMVCVPSFHAMLLSASMAISLSILL